MAISKIQSLIYAGFKNLSKESQLTAKQKETLLVLCDLKNLQSLNSYIAKKELSGSAFLSKLHKVRSFYKVQNNLNLFKVLVGKITDEDVKRVAQ